MHIMTQKFNSVSLIGYGQMGKLFENLFNSFAEKPRILLHDKGSELKNNSLVSLAEAAQAELIILCIPIDVFETVVHEICSYLKPGQAVMHICSVQVYPKEILLKYIPEGVNIIGSHPMFGPDSAKYGWQGQTFVYEKTRIKKVLLDYESEEQQYELDNDWGINSFDGRDEFCGVRGINDDDCEGYVEGMDRIERFLRYVVPVDWHSIDSVL